MQLDKNQESSRNGHLLPAISAGARLKTDSKKALFKSNGTQISSHSSRQSGKTRTADSSALIRTQVAQKPVSSPLQELARTQPSALPKDAKSLPSPLKIRIGRPQQKPASTPLITHDQLNNIPNRPRRSTRRHLSNGGLGSQSDRGVSLEDDVTT